MRSFSTSLTVFAFAASLASIASPALAQDGPKLGWADTAELSFVAVGGNAESSSLALRNTLTRTWEDALFKLEAGALRAETTTFDRRGRLLPDGSVEVIDNEQSELTAENYFVRGRYDAKFTPDLYWFGGAGWERNEFAGIANRYGVVGGLGKIWSATDTFKLKTDAGLTFTREEAVAALIEDEFLGFRLSYDLTRVLTPTTTWTSLLMIDGNFDQTSDYRGDWTNALAVAMTERLSLKATLQLLYDHEPGFVRVPVDLPPGVTNPRFFITQLDELDTLFSAALVVNF